MEQVKKLSKDDLLNSKVYYPSEGEADWIELKTAIFKTTQLDFCKQRVKDVANYLLKDTDSVISNELTRKIKELYKCFNRKEILDPTGQEINIDNIDYFIEACRDINGKDIFLRGGNKRAITYGMHLLRDNLKYEPVITLWKDNFTRYDWCNENNLETSKKPIKCD